MTTSPQITAAEWRWAMKWSIAILLLSCLPYLIATQAAPEGWTFAGFLANPLDGHSYMAKMQQGEAGRWLFHLSYTPEPHEGAFIFTFYLALGHLAAMIGLEKILVFHLARLLAGFGLLVVAFYFTSRVLSQPAERRLAFIFMLTAAGLGWIGVIFGAFPIDLWVPEAFVPYSLYSNPHFPLALMLMLIIFNQLLESINSSWETTAGQPLPEFSTSFLRSTLPSVHGLLWAGLAALALVIILPFSLIAVLLILGVSLVWLYLMTRRLPWPQIWLTLDVTICSVPILLYQYWVYITNPAMVGWSAQNITTAPRVVDFILGYGVIGLLAIVGITRIIRQNKADSTPGEWLVVLWVITAVALVYFPFALQRRLIHGLHVPLCLLAAIGLKRSLAHSWFQLSYRRLIPVAVVALGILGTLTVWGLPLLGLMQSPEHSYITALLFVRQEERVAFEWLRMHATPENVILASPRLSMMLPGQTGARVFYGHPFETLDAKNKEAQVRTFYGGELDSVSPQPDFIIYGPSEKTLGQPEISPTYSPVFSTGELTIYKVSDR